MARLKALAVIPTAYESPLLDDLKWTLISGDVGVLVVCNLPDTNRGTWVNHYPLVTYMNRPGWGIYRTWNFGLRCGAVWGMPTLILNDDVVLTDASVSKMIDYLRKSDWAILGFDYDFGHFPAIGCYPVETHGSFRQGGVGGFAFGCNPRRCARVDRRFMWWGGDDDLFLKTEKKGEAVGILRGAAVEHPVPSYTMNSRPDLLPKGWAANDRALLRELHGTSW